MSTKYLILLVLLIFVQRGLPGQQATIPAKQQTHEEIKSFLLETVKSVQTVSLADEQWLSEIIDGACDCSEMKDEQTSKACKDELLTRSFGISKEFIHPDELTEEQMNRFMLLTSLSGLLGKCPEHQQ